MFVRVRGRTSPTRTPGCSMVTTLDNEYRWDIDGGGPCCQRSCVTHITKKRIGTYNHNYPPNTVLKTRVCKSRTERDFLPACDIAIIRVAVIPFVFRRLGYYFRKSLSSFLGVFFSGPRNDLFPVYTLFVCDVKLPYEVGINARVRRWFPTPST